MILSKEKNLWILGLHYQKNTCCLTWYQINHLQPTKVTDAPSGHSKTMVNVPMSTGKGRAGLFTFRHTDSIVPEDTV